MTLAPEVYLFEDLVEGIGHFVETTGVKAEKRLTPEEAREVESEEKSLPHLTKPSEDTRWALADFARLVRPSEEVRRAMEKMAMVAEPSEEVRRAMEKMAMVAEPSEEVAGRWKR